MVFELFNALNPPATNIFWAKAAPPATVKAPPAVLLVARAEALMLKPPF
uniref:Uncharacterized protein n=1 Tax=viral metagenome TaxID=1070528 RepID=A0A6C0H6Z9_9ZZZZ